MFKKIEDVEFLTELHLVPVKKNTKAPWLKPKNNKFKLGKDFIIRITGDGGKKDLLVCPEGYITDMSSIPRVFWWLFPPSSTGARIASVPHDIIYSHYYRKYTKDFADRLFLKIMEKRGAGGFMKRVFFNAVKVGGSGGWKHVKDLKSDTHWHTHHHIPNEHNFMRWHEYMNAKAIEIH